MRVPPEITFRDVDKTPGIEKYIRENVAKLEEVCDRVVSCRVAVEKPQRHQRSGSPYRVRIDVRVPPGHEIVVRREPSEGGLHDDLRKSLRDAFDAARRRLKGLAERQRGETKSHPEQESMAIVLRLFPEEGYGFLRTAEGHEVYFHRNSVLQGGFDRMEMGTSVRFVAEEGEEGLQASTVQVVEQGAERSRAGGEMSPEGFGP